MVVVQHAAGAGIAQTLVQGVGLLLVALAGTFCLAAGLYTAAEWLEEHAHTSARITRRLLIWGTAVQAAGLLLGPASSTAAPHLVGLAAHGCGWAMLQQHPNHPLGLTAAMVALLIAHQTAWVLWWLSASGGPATQLVGVLCALVWPAPTVLLLSSTTTSDLPVATRQRSIGSGGGTATAARPLAPPAAAAAVWPQRRRAAPHRSESPGAAAEQDQGGLHRTSSASSTGSGGEFSLSPGAAESAAWVQRQQQQLQQQEQQQRQRRLVGGRPRRSRVVRAFDALLLQLWGRLPLTDAEAAAAEAPLTPRALIAAVKLRRER